MILFQKSQQYFFLIKYNYLIGQKNGSRNSTKTPQKTIFQHLPETNNKQTQENNDTTSTNFKQDATNSSSNRIIPHKANIYLKQSKNKPEQPKCFQLQHVITVLILLLHVAFTVIQFVSQQDDTIYHVFLLVFHILSCVKVIVYWIYAYDQQKNSYKTVQKNTQKEIQQSIKKSHKKLKQKPFLALHLVFGVISLISIGLLIWQIVHENQLNQTQFVKAKQGIQIVLIVLKIIFLCVLVKVKYCDNDKIPSKEDKKTTKDNRNNYRQK